MVGPLKTSQVATTINDPRDFNTFLFWSKENDIVTNAKRSTTGDSKLGARLSECWLDSKGLTHHADFVNPATSSLWLIASNVFRNSQEVAFRFRRVENG